MAVIDDLPPELLHRILQLGAQDEQCFQRGDLYSTALVAQAWAQPAQELLVYEWFSPHLPEAPEYTTSLPTSQLRAIVLNSPETVAKARHLVERHPIRLDEVNAGAEISAVDIAFFLEHGARAFSILGDVWDNLELPDGIQLALESLLLGSWFDSQSPKFLSDLFDKAPHLIRLVLVDHHMNKNLARDIQLPLITLAPQLRRLMLCSPIPIVDGVDYVALLRSCTSLRTLELFDLPLPLLCVYVSSIPSRLVLLYHDFNFTFLDGDEQVGKQLLGALALPALAELKRWRWGFRGIWNGQEQVPHAEGVVESWEAACRARGIEPRSVERYFTD